MDPYVVDQLFASRHDDLVREADEARLVRDVRDVHEEPPERPASGGARTRRLRVA